MAVMMMLMMVMLMVTTAFILTLNLIDSHKNRDRSQWLQPIVPLPYVFYLSSQNLLLGFADLLQPCLGFDLALPAS